MSKRRTHVIGRYRIYCNDGTEEDFTICIVGPSDASDVTKLAMANVARAALIGVAGTVGQEPGMAN